MTAAQGRVFQFIVAFIAEHGWPPTRAEIAAGLGFASPNAAQCHIECPQKQGVLWGGGGGARRLSINPAWKDVA